MRLENDSILFRIYILHCPKSFRIGIELGITIDLRKCDTGYCLMFQLSFNHLLSAVRVIFSSKKNIPCMPQNGPNCVGKYTDA